MAEVAKRVRVTGGVQGVGFRAWTQSRAQEIGLRGWVRNEPDGSVAALLCGEEAEVARMLESLRDGPFLASVEEVSAEDARSPAQTGFEIWS